MGWVFGEATDCLFSCGDGNATNGSGNGGGGAASPVTTEHWTSICIEGDDPTRVAEAVAELGVLLAGGAGRIVYAGFPDIVDAFALRAVSRAKAQPPP